MNTWKGRRLNITRGPADMSVSATLWFDQICESPIESMLLVAMVRDPSLRIAPQAQVGPYRVDFLVNERIIVECDGHEFHSSKEQRGQDAARDRALQAAGFRVLRFTGTEIYRDASGCSDEVSRHAATLGDGVVDASTVPKPVPIVEPPRAVETQLAVLGSLQQVRDTLGDCHRCNLCKERRQIVFGVGRPDADLVVIGEAPGYHEDQHGDPFIGPAGQLLDKMLDDILGLQRDQVYITNVVKCRPPKNRNPLPDELDACRPFLDAQFATVGPKVMLVLGSIVYRAMFNTESGISRNRGRWHEHQGVPVMPTFHPAYLLRQPEDKKHAEADFRLLRERYDALGCRRT